MSDKCSDYHNCKECPDFNTEKCNRDTIRKAIIAENLEMNKPKSWDEFYYKHRIREG